MYEPLLKEALSYKKAFTNDDEMYYKYQQREDAIREENTKIALGEKRGIKKGSKQGIKQNVSIGERKKAEELTKNMLADGVDIKFIAKYTKLSVDDIKNLK